MSNKKIRAQEQGFSLIELMVAIVILGILFAVAVPSLAGAIDRARMAQVKNNVNNFQNLIESYNLDKGEYPVFVQELNQTPYNSELDKFGNPFHLAGAPVIGDVFGILTFFLVYQDNSGNLDLGRGGVVMVSTDDAPWFDGFSKAGSTQKYYQGTVFYFPFTHDEDGDGRSDWAGGGNMFSPGSLSALLALKKPVIGYGIFALDGAGEPIKSTLKFSGSKLLCNGC